MKHIEYAMRIKVSSRHFDEDWIMDLCFFLEVKKLEHGLSKRSMEVKLPALLENYERPTYRRGGKTGL